MSLNRRLMMLILTWMVAALAGLSIAGAQPGFGGGGGSDRPGQAEPSKKQENP